jgi:hypothetical protein
MRPTIGPPALAVPADPRTRAAPASLTSVAFAGLSQALVTRGSAKLVMAGGMAMIGGGVLCATQVAVHGNFWSRPGRTVHRHRDRYRVASTLLRQRTIPAAALTSGFQWAFWACGAIGLAAVPVTFLLVRRDELATAVASTSQKPQRAPARV